MANQKFIQCPSCKERSFINVKKEYNDFDIIAEKKICGLCGYEFRDESEITYIKEKNIFNDDGEEKKNFCRDCRHYIVHPLTQKCMLTYVEVTALDGCERFEKKKK